MWDLGAWAWACYTAVLALIVGVGVAKEVHNWRRCVGPGPALLGRCWGSAVAGGGAAHLLAACRAASPRLLTALPSPPAPHLFRTCSARGQTYQKAFDTSAHSSARAQDAEAGAGPARADASAKVSTAGSFQSKAF